MGLGKTLTMISLVAGDLDSMQEGDRHMYGNEYDEPHISATLVIIPPPRQSYTLRAMRFTEILLVLGTWEEQLSEYI